MRIELVSERNATFGGPTHIQTSVCVYVRLYILSIYDELEEIQDCTPVLQNALEQAGAKPSH